jgi:cell division protease FtsH
MREQDEGMMLKSVEDMEWEIKQLYGGIAAEQMVYGKNGHTTGGADDIKRATRYLQHLIVENSVYSTSKLNYDILGAKESQTQVIEAKSKVLYEESMSIVQEYEMLLLYMSGVLMAEWSLTKDEIFEHIKQFKI